MGFVWFVGFVDDMQPEKFALRSWRELIATPLKSPVDVFGENTASTNQTNPQTPDSLRVSKWTGESTNRPQTSDGVAGGRARLEQIGPTTWVLAAWATALCVHCDEPLAAGDRTCCVEHRQQRDALVMPWEK